MLSKFSTKEFLHIRSLHGPPFAGKALTWELNKIGCYITMYSSIARSVVLKRRNRTTLELLGNILIHITAGSRLSPQMVEPCKEWIPVAKEVNFLILKDNRLKSFHYEMRDSSLWNERKYTFVVMTRLHIVDTASPLHITKTNTAVAWPRFEFFLISWRNVI